jgi:hypothetical protein
LRRGHCNLWLSVAAAAVVRATEHYMVKAVAAVAAVLL